ncbi:MAG TPA: glycosyltransferase family 2 protein [Firmicutes bacterium]|nr:glycosyltransferase family 2 protein [Bacillota bacterium]
MLAYNRGVGQIDIGQYDFPDQPMGACFAAFFARRDAFAPISKGGVGLLDAGFFMYYEDIDWCYRANLLGKKIIYEPSAVAWHHHSLTTRDLAIFFKYHLIQRNLYRTIMKNMRFRTVVKLWLMHARFHVRRAKVEKEFAPVTWKILAETLFWSPAGLMKRPPIQSRRKISDTDIINLSIGEEGHLDDVTLKPKENWFNPLASLLRLQKHFPDDPACELIPTVKKLADGVGDEETKRSLENSATEKCPALLHLIRKIPV